MEKVILCLFCCISPCMYECNARSLFLIKIRFLQKRHFFFSNDILTNKPQPYDILWSKCISSQKFEVTETAVQNLFITQMI